MKYKQTDIEGLIVAEPTIFGDSRGYFMETFRQQEFDEAVGKHTEFVQENESSSRRGVFRGIHFQRGDSAQAKLVRCITGRVIDIAVDLRSGSPTFGQYRAFDLSADNKMQVYIAKGFGHAFMVLSPEATFVYKVDSLYDPSSECCIRYDDPQLCIPFHNFGLSADEFIISDKDRQGISLDEAESRGFV